MFTFSMVYRNPDGLKPRSAQLWLKGGSQFFPYDMAFVEGNQVTGYRYSTTKYCGADQNQFHFVATAADGTTYREPSSGAYDGLTIADVLVPLRAINAIRRLRAPFYAAVPSAQRRYGWHVTIDGHRSATCRMAAASSSGRRTA